MLRSLLTIEEAQEEARKLLDDDEAFNKAFHHLCKIKGIDDEGLVSYSQCLSVLQEIVRQMEKYNFDLSSWEAIKNVKSQIYKTQKTSLSYAKHEIKNILFKFANKVIEENH